jgi:hypothetical protein
MILAFVLTKLEIYGFSLKTIVNPIAWIAIGVIIYRINRHLRGSGPGIRKSMLGIVFALYVFGSFFLGLRFFMCGATKTGSIYVSVQDEDLHLQCRTYECFQTTGQCQFTQLRTLVRNVQWSTLLERDEVDLSKWRISLTSE